MWQVDHRQNEQKRFELTWVTAVRLCETAAEAAYVSGEQLKNVFVCFRHLSLWTVDGSFAVALWVFGRKRQGVDGQDGPTNDPFQSLNWNYYIFELLSVFYILCVFSGAENASVTVSTNIQLAKSQVEEAQKLSLDAEKKLRETKAMEVERMTQHATTVEGSNDEEEMPEAYLRED